MREYQPWESESADPTRSTDRAGHEPLAFQTAGFGGGVVDMEGVKVTRKSGEQDHVRFGHGSSRALPLIANHKVVK